MKIVRIIARLNVGGPARHVVWLTRGLNSGEDRSVLLAGTVPEGEEDMGYFAGQNDVEPVYIREMSRELSPKDAVSLWRVFQHLRRERPDIIHTHTAKAGTVGRIAGFLYRWLSWKDVKIVHTFHGHVFHSYYGRTKTAVFILIEKALARFATDRIIVISERQRDEICNQYGVGQPQQFAVVPLGIDHSKFTGGHAKRRIFREELGIADGEILIGFVGRLTEIKNIRLLLEAAAKLRANEKIRFVIVGDGHLRTELEELARDLQIGQKIAFVGNRDDADVFYSGLDFVALCSLNEGTPLTLIEAMANSRPFVSTAVGGVPDLAGAIVESRPGFDTCERGLTVASGDIEGFATALEFLAENGRLRSEMGERGKRFVDDNYSLERLLADIRRLYAALLEVKR